ncbi:Glycoside hydrolase superfamily [Amanita muscaria]
MKPFRLLHLLLLFIRLAVAQQIIDIWQTTWDSSDLFTHVPMSSSINFVTPGPVANADVVVSDSVVFQQIDGIGASLTDSSALILSNLKNTNWNAYWSLLNHMFNTTYGANAAGFSYIRIPIGASDFSANLYSFDDVGGDTSFSSFNVNNAPSYLFAVLSDIMTINTRVKVHVLPWSPPGWMKDSDTMNGGNLLTQYYNIYPTYLLKAVQGFRNKGIPIYAISIQNEPQNTNPTYPTCTISSNVEAQLGNTLRSLLNSNGFGNVKIVAYDHNWDNAATYPEQVLQNAYNAFSGASFHCYAGSVSNQQAFYNAYPAKELYFTECSGTFGTDWWNDVKWYMDNIFIGSLQYWARTALMWNLALDGSGNPKLPGTNSCGAQGCRAVVTVNNDGTYVLNQEFWAMAQASKAIIPKDPGGPFGQRIGVTVNGAMSWALRVGAYVVNRANSADWKQYSLVVLNWNDNTAGAWNPQPVAATIEFRGKQASYTFPVGVTTLWWFAP